jgi:hypothetical protein
MRKKVVGEIKGKTIVQNLFTGPAPSIAEASNMDFGIDCNPARKKIKL